MEKLKTVCSDFSLEMWRFFKNKVSFKYLSKVLIHLALFSFFRFPKWHIFATDQNRNYKKSVADTALEIKVDFYCEIGCGLAEIIGGLNKSGSKLFGVDTDSSVLKGARVLNRNIDFLNLDVFSSNNRRKLFSVLDNSNPNSGMFIIVNWANTSQIEEFISLIKGFKWCHLKTVHLIFDVRTSNSEDRKEYAYIPSRQLIEKFGGTEINTGDFERNICRVSFFL